MEFGCKSGPYDTISEGASLIYSDMIIGHVIIGVSMIIGTKSESGGTQGCPRTIWRSVFNVLFYESGGVS